MHPGIPKIEVYGLRLPEIKPGDDLAKLIIEAAEFSGVRLREGDVVVVTSKALLKSMGLLYRLSDVRPTFASRVIARLTGKDPVEVELVLKAAEDVVAVIDVRGLIGRHLGRISSDLSTAQDLIRRVPSLIAVKTMQGLIALDGGVDYSNLPPGHAISNVIDFDDEADRLRDRLEELTGLKLAVVIADTEFNLTGKVGSIDVAVGSSGIRPVAGGFGSKDLYGRPKFGGVDIVVDEIAAAAALLMGQTSEGVPVAIVRGLKYEDSSEHVRDYAIGLSGIPLDVIVKTLLVKAVYKLLYRRATRRPS